MKNKSAYAAAGVNIDEKMGGLSAIRKMVARTATPGVLSGIGPFGGMFKSPGRDSILVSSTDGVGTKLKVAALMQKFDTVGQDIVNHCVNDILVQGAFPLFFMDYIAAPILSSSMITELVSGICRACIQNKCALLGGETAEMPGVYLKGEFDLVGTIVGQVDKRRVITGERIKAGHAIIALPSSGLHTNGYSLARKALLSNAGLSVSDKLPGTGTTVGKALLAVHRSYLKPVQALLKSCDVRGMAHITGGGFQDNIPRILPDGIDAVIDCTSWKPGPLFRQIQKHASVEPEEMYRVFNMGIGYVIIVPEQSVSKALLALRKAGEHPFVCGFTRKGSRRTSLLNAS